jgi:hypothetical protein
MAPKYVRLLYAKQWINIAHGFPHVSLRSSANNLLCRRSVTSHTLLFLISFYQSIFIHLFLVLLVSYSKRHNKIQSQKNRQTLEYSSVTWHKAHRVRSEIVSTLDFFFTNYLRRCLSVQRRSEMAKSFRRRNGIILYNLCPLSSETESVKKKSTVWTLFPGLANIYLKKSKAIPLKGRGGL